MKRTRHLALAVLLVTLNAGTVGADSLSCGLNPTSPGSDVTAAKSTILDMHNQVRNQFGNAALTWDDTLANYAQGWADALVAFNNDPNESPPGNLGVHSDRSCYANNHGGNSYGENIVSGGIEARRAVQAWLDEQPNYQEASRTCASCVVW